MSTADPTHPAAAQVPPATDTTPEFDEIRVYSHSPLFYWWPVWLFGFIFAVITLMDGDRMAIVPGESLVVKENVEGGKVRETVYTPSEDRDLMETVTIEASAKDRERLAG